MINGARTPISVFITSVLSIYFRSFIGVPMSLHFRGKLCGPETIPVTLHLGAWKGDLFRGCWKKGPPNLAYQKGHEWMEEAWGISFINAYLFKPPGFTEFLCVVFFFVWLICYPQRILLMGWALDFFSGKKKGLWKIGVSAPSMERLDVNWWWWDGHFTRTKKATEKWLVERWN